MDMKQVPQRQRLLFSGRDGCLDAGRCAQPAVVADVPAGWLAGVGGMIEIGDTFDLIAFAICRAAIINPASRSLEQIPLRLSSLAAGQNAAAKDG